MIHHLMCYLTKGVKLGLSGFSSRQCSRFLKSDISSESEVWGLFDGEHDNDCRNHAHNLCMLKACGKAQLTEKKMNDRPTVVTTLGKSDDAVVISGWIVQGASSKLFSEELLPWLTEGLLLGITLSGGEGGLVIGGWSSHVFGLLVEC